MLKEVVDPESAADRSRMSWLLRCHSTIRAAGSALALAAGMILACYMYGSSVADGLRDQSHVSHLYLADWRGRKSPTTFLTICTNATDPHVSSKNRLKELWPNIKILWLRLDERALPAQQVGYVGDTPYWAFAGERCSFVHDILVIQFASLWSVPICEDPLHFSVA